MKTKLKVSENIDELDTAGHLAFVYEETRREQRKSERMAALLSECLEKTRLD